MRKVTLFLISLCIAVFADAAINAQYNFEKEFPHFVAVKGNATVILSQEKFKDGTNSVKFS